MKTIYKVIDQAQWETAKAAGVFAGAAIDLQDGYIHFSTAEQVVETVRKHFAGQANLLLLSVDAETFGDDLKWEVSRNEQLFPHLYGTLDPAAVALEEPLPIGGDGLHQFPARFDSI